MPVQHRGTTTLCSSTPNTMSLPVQLPVHHHGIEPISCTSTPNQGTEYSATQSTPNVSTGNISGHAQPNSDSTVYPLPYTRGCCPHALSISNSCSQANQCRILIDLNGIWSQYAAVAPALESSSSSSSSLSSSSTSHQGHTLSGPVHYGTGPSVDPTTTVNSSTWLTTCHPQDFVVCATTPAVALYADHNEVVETNNLADTAVLEAGLMNHIAEDPHASGLLNFEPSILNAEILPAGQVGLEGFWDNNFDATLQGMFDFNDASLEEGQGLGEPNLLDMFDFDGAALEDGPQVNADSQSFHEGPEFYGSSMQDNHEVLKLQNEMTSLLPTSTSIPSPPIPSSITARPPTNRPHRCTSCNRAFRRPSDRDRHAQTHNPNAPRHSCPFHGCPRAGRDGFLRRDKLTQHQGHMRH